MAIRIQGKTYAVPGEGIPNVTGREIATIEDYFGLDGMRLISTLDPDAKQVKGYTQTKALYALAWVCMTRGGETVSIDDVLEISIDEIEPVDDENPTEAAAS